MGNKIQNTPDKPKTDSGRMTYRNRVKELIIARAADLLDNEGNWRIHPQFQQEALEGELEETGITDVLKAYYSGRNGGKLTLVDGHLRKSIDAEQLWPVAVLDINDEEADQMLASFDAITGWAEINPLKLHALLQKAQTDNAKRRAANERLAEQIREQVAIAQRAAGDPGAPPKPTEQFAGYHQLATVKVVCAVGHDLSVVERAIQAAGVKNRGEALALICRHFLETRRGK